MNCTKKFLALLMVLAMALGMTAVAESPGGVSCGISRGISRGGRSRTALYGVPDVCRRQLEVPVVARRL